MTTAQEILKKAAQHMNDRAARYDTPGGERSMSATVSAFNAITGSTLTDTQGWLFMAVLKAVRSQQGDYHADSFEDGAAYFALAGEAACFDRMSDSESREAILDALNKCKNTDGEWIKWSGEDWEGPIGLHGDTMVNVLFRGEGDSGETMDVDMIKELYWGLDGDDADIIAYRIVE